MTSRTETLIEILAKIKPGETINLKTREIVIYNSWYSTFTRTWYGENRESLEQYIIEIMTQEVESYQIISKKELKDSQRNKIITALSGIRNICVTYVGTNVADSLSKLVSEIERKIAIYEVPRSTPISILNPHNSGRYYHSAPTQYNNVI